MKILLLVTGFPSRKYPQRGIFALRSAKNLATSVSVTVVHLRGWRPGLPLVAVESYGTLTIRRVSVPQLPRGSSLPIQCLDWNLRFMDHFGWRGVRDIAEEHHIIHSVGAVGAGVVGSAWSRRSGLAHITQVIGDDLNSLMPQLINSKWANWHQQIDGAVCNSEALREKLLSMYPLLPNVQTVRNGVDLHEFSPLGKTAGPHPERGTLRFLFVGGFPLTREYGRNLKGGETLLAAWKRADEVGIGAIASLTIAGPGSDSPEIRNWRSSLLHPDAVHIAGIILPCDMPDWLRSCDVVLLPSLVEGLPNIAMEAAACGKPVVGQRVGGVPEVVVHERTGFLVDARDVSTWADVLLRCARNGDSLQGIGRNARAFAEATFSDQAYSKTMLSIYRDALSWRQDARTPRT